MIDKLVAKLRIYDKFDTAEEAALRNAVSGVRRYSRGEVIVRAREPKRICSVVLDGMVHRYKTLSNGRRQSLELSIPGDFVDLHSFTMKRIDHDIACLATCRLAEVPHDRLEAITVHMPHLARVLWLSTMIDAAIHRELIVSLGARSAVERMAQLFCEMADRYEAVGLGSRSGYTLPLTQQDLAEVLGLSLVHANRTLRELRERGLATLRNQQLTIHHWAGLAALAEFDPFYLFLDRSPAAVQWDR
jgi:CRP-like cAMP-binding protein